MDRRKEFVGTFEYSSVEQKAIDILVQISGALSFMHDHHVVHRDVKPENILLVPSASGITAKIGDLGSARHIAETFEERLKSDLTHYVREEQSPPSYLSTFYTQLFNVLLGGISYLYRVIPVSVCRWDLGGTGPRSCWAAARTTASRWSRDET